MGRKNQVKMTGLTVSGRVERAAKRKFQKEEDIRRRRLAVLEFMLR